MGDDSICLSTTRSEANAHPSRASIAAPPTSTFAFFSYVPDHAPVRQKMLYASTQNTLVKSLGDSRIPVSIFATGKACIEPK